MTIIEKLEEIAKSFDYWTDTADAKTCREAIAEIEMDRLIMKCAVSEITSLRLEVDRLLEVEMIYDGLCQ